MTKVSKEEAKSDTKPVATANPDARKRETVERGQS